MEMKENSFNRVAQNVAKLGAYYTDLDHCRRIGNLFDFDAAKEICVLEPSIGDGKAVLAVTGGRPNIRIYGVELNKKTYDEDLKGHSEFAGILNEDFLRGIKISQGAFSFCFANPPYGEARDEKKRLEALFVEKMTGYLKGGAYLALVIPFPVFKEESFIRLLLARYELKSFYRFDDKEYEKYHQVAVILRKKESGKFGYLRSVFEESYAKVQKLEDYPYLPEEPDGERFVVQESMDSQISYFTSLHFHAEDAVESIGKSALLDDIGTYIFQKPYTGCDLNQPIVPVSKEISYLLAVIGGGQGYAGSADDRTLHLQRGVANRVRDDKVETDQDGKPTKVVSSTYTKIKLNIVENSGKVTQL